MKNALVALAMILAAPPASVASADDEEPPFPVIEMWNHVHEVRCQWYKDHVAEKLPDTTEAILIGFLNRDKETDRMLCVYAYEEKKFLVIIYDEPEQITALVATAEGVVTIEDVAPLPPTDQTIEPSEPQLKNNQP